MKQISCSISRMIAIIISFSVLISSCSKDEKKEDDPMPEYPGGAGLIPGFGEAGGEPQGTPFELPQGVELVGEIRGNEEPRTNEECFYDGPGYNVLVKIRLKRTMPGGSPIRVEFPAGLVIVSTSEGRNQNGLLIEKTIVELPPLIQGGAGSHCDFTLLLPCANEERDPSSSYHTYEFGPVTNSPLVKDFIKRVTGKKINRSDYSQDQEEERKEAQQAVQDLLYSITDGRGYNPAVLAAIGKIPAR